MRAYYHPEQSFHSPRQFMRLGKISDPKDTPDRTKALLKALTAFGLMAIRPREVGVDELRAVHAPQYLDFLATAYERWIRLDDAGEEVLPNTFPYWNAAPQHSRPPCPSDNVVAQAGYYLGDLAVPIGKYTWKSAVASASTALAGADALLDGDTLTYCLCRPSGHHARADRANGFCYLNNAALVAERLRQKFKRVAIIDIDAHHGDGTEAIFYGRPDVLTVSIHVDPQNYYPYFTGYNGSCGVGAGQGANLNICLQPAAGDAELIYAIRSAMEAAESFGAEVLVVPLGFDSHAQDPLSVLRVTTKGFGLVGEALGSARAPVIVVQEGGYAVSVIGDCLFEFLSGLRNRKPG